MRNEMTRESWQLIAAGSADEFVSTLISEAKQHPAVHHPYLQGLRAGAFPDMFGALRDYAYQYGFYGSEFPNYVEGVIGGLHSLKHREVLRENLEEEKGIVGSDDVNTMPHTQLFGQFKTAVGVNLDLEEANKPCTTVMIWRDLFLQKCQSRQPGLGIGAIGIGTEMVVPIMYQYIVEGMKGFTDLAEIDYHFFTLHMECDVQHSDDLVLITRELSQNFDVREAIRFGVFSSLNLRKAFWDVLLSRAIQMKPNPASKS